MASLNPTTAKQTFYCQVFIFAKFSLGINLYIKRQSNLDNLGHGKASQETLSFPGLWITGNFDPVASKNFHSTNREALNSCRKQPSSHTDATRRRWPWCQTESRVPGTRHRVASATDFWHLIKPPELLSAVTTSQDWTIPEQPYQSVELDPPSLNPTKCQPCD